MDLYDLPKPGCFGKFHDKNAPECAGGFDKNFTSVKGNHVRERCLLFEDCGGAVVHMKVPEALVRLAPKTKVRGPAPRPQREPFPAPKPTCNKKCVGWYFDRSGSVHFCADCQEDLGETLRLSVEKFLSDRPCAWCGQYTFVDHIERLVDFGPSCPKSMNWDNPWDEEYVNVKVVPFCASCDASLKMYTGQQQVISIRHAMNRNWGGRCALFEKGWFLDGGAFEVVKCDECSLWAWDEEAWQFGALPWIQNKLRHLGADAPNILR